MTVTPPSPASATAFDAAPTDQADVLRAIAQRVLWLSAAIVDAANRGRPNNSGVPSLAL